MSTSLACLLSMIAFDLASDILLLEALLSLNNNKHIYSLKMEDERLVLKLNLPTKLEEAMKTCSFIVIFILNQVDTGAMSSTKNHVII